MKKTLSTLLLAIFGLSVTPAFAQDAQEEEKSTQEMISLADDMEKDGETPPSLFKKDDKSNSGCGCGK